MPQWLFKLLLKGWHRCGKHVYSHEEGKKATTANIPHHGQVAINYADNVIYMNHYGSILVFKPEAALCLVRKEQSK